MSIDIPLTISMPPYIENALRIFLTEFPFDRNVFIMMRYRETPQFQIIERTIRATLEDYGLKGHMARDRAYTDDLWGNVCVYMVGCKYGIAVFEEIEERSFNPNIAIEIGYMYALGRKCLLLKDNRMPSMPTDIIGKLYKTFDVFNIADSVEKQVREWIEHDLRIVPIRQRIPRKGFTVCISGSSQTPDVALMCRTLGKGLVALGISLITGGGAGVGMPALEAALEVIEDHKEMDRIAITLLRRTRPGQQIAPASLQVVQVGSIEELREILVESSDMVIFIGGGAGTWEEYKVALRKQKPILPVGATGGTAAVICSKLPRPSFISPEEWEVLRSPMVSYSDLAQIVLDIVQQYRSVHASRH